MDSTHVKARANGKKYEDAIVEEQALWYSEELKAEIQRDHSYPANANLNYANG